MDILLEVLKVVVCLAILAAVINSYLTRTYPQAAGFAGVRDDANSQRSKARRCIAKGRQAAWQQAIAP